MQINVTDTLRIKQLDDYNFVIEELKKVERKDGTVEMEWKHTGTYHPDVISTIKKLNSMIESKKLSKNIYNSIEEYSKDNLKILEEIRDNIIKHN